jgi:transcriptional regulator with XRE-family HTH domain
MGPESVGSRIRRLRRRAGISQSQLAGVELSPSYVSLIEADKRVASDETLRVLAERLGCTPEELTGTPEQIQLKDLEVELRYAEISLRNGDAEAAKRTYQTAREVAARSGQQELVHAAELGIAQCLEHLGMLEDAVHSFEKLLALPENKQNILSRLTIVTALCRCYRELGDLSHAIEIAESALHSLEKFQIPPTLVGVELLSTLVGIHIERGDLHHAAYLASTAIEQARVVSDPRALGAAYWNASITMHRNDKSADALTLIEKALAIYSEGEDERSLSRLQNSYATVLLQKEDPDPHKAKELLQQSAVTLERVGSRVDLAYCQTALARANLLIGDTTSAHDRATQALELLGTKHRLETARTLSVLAAAHLADNNIEAAQEACKRGALILEASEANRQAGFAWAELAEIYELSGDAESAMWAYRQTIRCMGHRTTLISVFKSVLIPDEPGR